MNMNTYNKCYGTQRRYFYIVVITRFHVAAKLLEFCIERHKNYFLYTTVKVSLSLKIVLWPVIMNEGYVSAIHKANTH